MRAVTVQRVCAFFLSMWVSSVLIARTFEFGEAWRRERAHWYQDEVTAQTVCRDFALREKLGRHASLCDHARTNLLNWPLAQAFYHVKVNIHPCGDTPCLDLVRRVVTDPVAIMMMVAGYVFSGGVLFQGASRAIEYVDRKRRQKKYLSEVCSDSDDDEDTERDAGRAAGIGPPVVYVPPGSRVWGKAKIN